MAGKEFHQTVFIIKALITVLMLSSFGTNSSGFKNVADPNNFDIDKGLVDQMKCIWHVMCDMKEPLEIKKAVDVVHVKVLEHYIAEILPLVPDFVRDFATVEDAKNDSLWLEMYQPTACAMSEDKRDEIVGSLAEDMAQYSSDICSCEDTTDECETMEQSSVIYHMMVKDMIEREECEIADSKYV